MMHTDTANRLRLRLVTFADNIEQYGIEQAIIYAYGLPDGGCAERHRLLIADIRAVVSGGE